MTLLTLQKDWPYWYNCEVFYSHGTGTLKYLVLKHGGHLTIQETELHIKNYIFTYFKILANKEFL